jgi:phytol kinase
MNPYLATVLTFAISLLFLRLMDFFAHRGWIESKLSRKVIHIGTGPIFVLCWLMFPDVPISRWLAALVPLAITVQFALVGFGVMKDESSVQAMSRTGDRREILRGPLFYGIIFVVLTILYWKDSPIGITALMMMCGGDGIADIVGRRIKSPLAGLVKKAGSTVFAAGGYVHVLIAVYVGGFASFRLLLPVTWIALGATLVNPCRLDVQITLTWSLP